MNEQNITLRVDHVTKRYGEFVAVNDLSFDVRAGRIFGFLGPNGAGKTSTIRMIVGITAPDSGKVELFGQTVSPELQNRIGYLPEERGLYKRMRIVDQLRYFAALKNLDGRKADERIEYWLNRVGLPEWKSKKAADLSKGMQQKIQFISAVMHEPNLIILDEPFSGLDPINVEVLQDIVLELKAAGKTIIFSTHLMSTAERLCDDIFLINHSQKVLAGTLREVKASFNRNSIALRATNTNSILEDKSLVSKATVHADELEILLIENAEPQTLLKRLVESGAKISKFELIEPSLNDISIEKVASKLVKKPKAKFMKTKVSLILMMFGLMFTQTACWVVAEEGTVKVQTVYGKIIRIIRATDGGVWTVFTYGDEYYPVTMRATTDSVDVTASSKDNAALTLKVSVTYRTAETDEQIASYVRKFGLDESERHTRRGQILNGQVNTETKNAIARFDAYSILANQEQIQQQLFQTLKPIFAQQLLLELESVQLIGRPDFLDDRIEQAASQVVANQKLKEAATAALEASKIEAERKQVEAQSYANPSLLEIRKLELQREIAAEWSEHQGTLVLGGGADVQVTSGK